MVIMPKNRNNLFVYFAENNSFADIFLKSMLSFLIMTAGGERMFEVGQFIVYGSSGVCKVVDIGKIEMPGMPKDRIYYTLEPCYTKGSRILTPIDNQKTIMRRLMTKEEADELIDGVGDIEILWIPDERRREESYKTMIAKCDCKELVKVIKTIYLRKEKRIAAGKKVTISDEKYFKLAEDNLYSELAVVLDMTKEEAREYMLNRIEKDAVIEE